MNNMGQYKEMFLAEARDHLKTMNASLLDFEKNSKNPPKQTECVENIFRAVHTLKSMAATMKYEKTALLCHAMEDILDEARKKKQRLEEKTDLLFECFDFLGTTLRDLEKNRPEGEPADLVQRLKSGDVRITPSSLAGEGLGEGPVSPTISVKVERLDVLMKLAEELLIGKMRLDRIREGMEHPELTAAVDSLSRVVTDIQYNIMQARMVPIGTIFERFPRMVRDLAKQEKKEIDLVMEGESLELDRSVLNQIGEPLVHLLRNAVDHGIELPEARQKGGKNPRAVIKLSATRERDSAMIVVEDDGRGVDMEAIKAMALKRGILSPGAEKEEVLQTLFSGISTARQVTEISGRGLGLNIVKKKVEAIGGTLKVESNPGLGTRFIIELPLTLAIVSTLFVRVGEEMFAIPLATIERLVTASDAEIHGQLGTEAIILDGEDVPLIRLKELFGHQGEAGGVTHNIVVVHTEKNKVGLVVDSLLTTQEVVIKPLNRWLRENRYFSGSTIIGSGEVVLILDVTSLVGSKKGAMHRSLDRRPKQAPADERISVTAQVSS